MVRSPILFAPNQYIYVDLTAQIHREFGLGVYMRQL